MKSAKSVDDIIYRASRDLRTTSGSDRSQRKFDLGIGHSEVIELLMAVFTFHPTTVLTGFNELVAGISSNDFDEATDAVDASTVNQFYERNDIIVAQPHGDVLISGVGSWNGQNYQQPFWDSPIVFPRVPTFVVLHASGADAFSIHCTIYFHKRKVTKEQLMMWMKMRRNIRAQQPARIIDE